MIDILNEYMAWLFTKIMGVHYARYTALCYHLLTRPFRSKIRLDRARAMDGLCLRERFSAETGIPLSDFNMEECSVLEMLVALARRFDREWVGEPGRPDVYRRFMEFIENLKLDMFDDPDFDPKAVDEILDIWMDRKFEKNGVGSIFPLKSDTFETTHKDQRRIEIWNQMMCYIKD